MKIRLFVKPPQKPSVLLELAVPEDAADAEGRLKCFSPPPDNRAEQAEFGQTKAWAVEIPPEEVSEIVERTRGIRVVPFVDTRPRGAGGSPVELVISDGQAEAKLSWWMNAPAGWTAAEELVEQVVRISQRGGTAIPVELAPPDDEDEDPEADGAGPPSSKKKKKKGFFGRLRGG